MNQISPLPLLHSSMGVLSAREHILIYSLAFCCLGNTNNEFQTRLHLQWGSNRGFGFSLVYLFGCLFGGEQCRVAKSREMTKGVGLESQADEHPPATQTQTPMQTQTRMLPPRGTHMQATHTSAQAECAHSGALIGSAPHYGHAPPHLCPLRFLLLAINPSRTSSLILFTGTGVVPGLTLKALKHNNCPPPYT